MATSIASTSSPIGLRIKPGQVSQTLSFNPVCYMGILKQKHGRNLRSKQSFLLYVKLTPTTRRKQIRDFTVRGFAQPDVPLPSGPPSDSWKSWIIGMLLTVALPFITHKWGPLLKLKNDIETAVETVENVVEAVEKVAEEVEKVAEDIADDLPEGGKLQNAVVFVENVAKAAAKNAQVAHEFIDKVEDSEEKLDKLIESVTDEANVVETIVDKALEVKHEEEASKSDKLIESVTDEANLVATIVNDKALEVKHEEEASK